MEYWSIFVSLLTVLVTSCQASGPYEKVSFCPEVCSCKDSPAGLVVECCSMSKKSKSVPILPKTTVAVNLSACHIDNIPNGTFRNLSRLDTLIMQNSVFTMLYKNSFQGLGNLRYLDLASGELENVEAGVFTSLTSISIIMLQFNQKLRLSSIPRLLHGLNETNTLQELYLDRINNRHHTNEFTLHGNYLETLRTMNLRVFSLRDADIREANLTLLKVLNNVRCVSLRRNQIHTMPLYNLGDMLLSIPYSKTVLLDLKYQIWGYKRIDFNQFNATCNKALEESETLRCPRISPQQIRRILVENPNFFLIPFYPKLQWLNLGYMAGRLSTGNVIVGNNNLTHFNMEGDRHMHVIGPIIGLTCLQHLSVAGTELIFPYATSFIKYFPNLEYLNLSSCSLEPAIKSGNFLIENLEHLKVFDLSGNSISEITLSDVDRTFPKLSQLFLNDNKLKDVPHVMSSSLTFLDMRSNKLTGLSDQDREILNNLFKRNKYVTIDIDGNPFDCQCSSQTYAFIKWIQLNALRITGVANIQCSIPSRKGIVLKKVLGISVPQFQTHCRVEIIIGLAGTSATLVCVSAIAVICYRKRWFLMRKFYQLQIWFWNMQACITPKHEEDSENGYLLADETFNSLVEENDNDCRLLGEDEVEEKRLVYIIYDTRRDTSVYNFVHGDLAAMLRRMNLDPVFHLRAIKLRNSFYFLGNRPETLDVVEIMEQCYHCVVVLDPPLIHECPDTDIEDSFDIEEDTRLTNMAMHTIHMALSNASSFVTTILFHQPPLQTWMDKTFQKYLKMLYKADHTLQFDTDPDSLEVIRTQLGEILSTEIPEGRCCLQ